MKTNYIIENAEIVNENKCFIGNVLLIDGMIHDILQHEEVSKTFLKENKIQRINALGKILIPGVIDDQVHFREPGLTQKGDMQSESRAAVAGGVTSFMEMPNTIPQTTTIDLLEEKYQLAAEKSYANYSFYLGATNDNMEELRKFDPRKYPGIKVFLGSSTGNMLVNQEAILEQIFSLPFLIAIHSEDEEIIQRNMALFREKYGENVPFWCHPLIRSAEACSISTARAIDLAKRLNTRLHVLHISTDDEVKLFSKKFPLAKKMITSEVCVQHLRFTDADYQRLGTKLKWNPAIKSSEDNLSLLNGVQSKTIDIIASDHAPHRWEEKQLSYFKAPSGGPMVQHGLLSMVDWYLRNKFSIYDIVNLMCHNPAVCFKVKKRGFIRKNYHADLVLLDTEGKTKVDKSSILSKCGWSVFEGQTFNGKIATTFVNGQIAYNGKRVSEERWGERLAFNSKWNGSF